MKFQNAPMSLMKTFDIFQSPLTISSISLMCFGPVSMLLACHYASLMICRCQILIRELWATGDVSIGAGKLSKACSYDQYSSKERI